METKTLNAHLPLPLAEKLDALADALDVPRDSIVTEAIANWIEREERQRIFTLQSLASNSLIIVEHHRVIDWADSLCADRLRTI
jgi:predicted transcriptional regulator